MTEIRRDGELVILPETPLEIVKRVNAHEELLEALQNIEANLTGPDNMRERIVDSLRRAKEAIAKATGGDNMKYIVTCDDCKKTIRETDNVRESYQGGHCNDCQKPVITDFRHADSCWCLNPKN